MNVTLTPHLKKFVDRRVKSGGYRDASEVIREALRLLQKVEVREAADLEALIAEADGEASTHMTGEDWAYVRRQVLGTQRKAAA